MLLFLAFLFAISGNAGGAALFLILHFLIGRD